MKISRRYTLECAHHLPNVDDHHKCRRLHGHSYVVEVVVAGRIDQVKGWICDFADIDKVFMANVHSKLDHRYLNEVKGLENPTCENLARWIWGALEELPLAGVVVRETERSVCYYEGE
jgi:6-pyruvoyltetrahydropterin/6-carboxytetrahydropterin synthase